MPSVGSGAAGARALPGTCHVPKDAGISGDSPRENSPVVGGLPTLIDVRWELLVSRIGDPGYPPRKYLSAQVFQFPVETEHNSKDDLQGYKKHFRKTPQQKQVQ